MAFNDRISDGLVRHNISLLRYDAKLRRQTLGQLRTLQQNLVEQLGSYDFTAIRRVRVEGLLKQVDGMIKGSYSGMNRFMAGEMGDLAITENAFASQQLNSLFGVDIVSGGLAPAQLRVLGKQAPIFGAPATEHWGRQSAALRRRFADEMRQGFLLGESTGDLVRRVRGTATGARQMVEIAGKAKSVPVFSGGIMNASTREATALVRTSVQSVANDIRLETYMANTDVIESLMVLVTLDARTSDICRARGARPDEWTLPDFEPVGSSGNYMGPPPWHFNCRSSLVPNTKSWAELQAQGGASTATRQQKSIARKLDNNAPKAARASMNGQVAKGMGYTQWLKTQPKSVQLEVLGPTRQKLWKQGKLNLSQTLDQTGRPMSLAEMGFADSAAIGRKLPTLATRRAPLAKPDAFIAPPTARTLTFDQLKTRGLGDVFSMDGVTYKVIGKTPESIKLSSWSTRTGKFVTARNAKTFRFADGPPGGGTGGGGLPGPGTTTTTGIPKAPLVDSANYRTLKLGDIFKDTEGNVWKVYGSNARGVKVVPWSTKSNRFLAPRNGKTLGFTSNPAKTVKQFKQSTANTTEQLKKTVLVNKKTGSLTRELEEGLKKAQSRMGENGFNKELAKLMSQPRRKAMGFNMGSRLGNLKDPWGGKYTARADGTYWSHSQHLGMRSSNSIGRSAKVWTHEFGHHMDYTLFRNRGRIIGRGAWREPLSATSETLLKELDDAYKAMIGEYRAASKEVGKRLGLRLKGGIMSEGQQARHWHSINRHLDGLGQSSYSLNNELEWFAESFSHYFNFDGGRALMARIQPKTHQFMQTLFSRHMEPLWKELTPL